MNSNSIQDEFVVLLKQNIKSNIEIKGENNMNFSFPDNVGKKLDELQNNSSSINQNTRHSEQSVHQERANPIQNQQRINPSVHQERPNPSVHQERPNPIQNQQRINPSPMGSGISASDFEKLKEDLILRVDSKMEEIDNMLQKRLEVLDNSIAALDEVGNKLSNSSTTYYEINTLLEKMQSENNKTFSDIKNDLEQSISKISSTLSNEIERTDAFIEELLNDNSGLKNKKKASTSYRKEEDDEENEQPKKNTKRSYNEEDDEENDEEDEQPKKNTKSEEDEDLFVKNNNKKSAPKKGLMGSIFSKLGL